MPNGSNPTDVRCRFFPSARYHPQNAYAGALALMEEAIEDERGDELFYGCLLEMAPSRQQRSIIAAIIDDEAKHQNMFRQIYCELTGKTVFPTAPERPEPPENLLTGIQMALFGELQAVEKYRKILFGLEAATFRNMVIEIITDEIKHASKWNFLSTLNACQAYRRPDPL